MVPFQNGNPAIEKGTSATDPKDLTIIGNYTPRFRFGFSLAADYTGFSYLQNKINTKAQCEESVRFLFLYLGRNKARRFKNCTSHPKIRKQSQWQSQLQ